MSATPINLGRPVRLRHSRAWGASTENRDIKPGHLLLIKTRGGKKRIGVVHEIVHKGETETIVSLVNPAAPIPQPKKAK